MREMIETKTDSEIERMRKPARITSEILAALREKVRPGVTTGDLDREAERLISKWAARSGARSAFKNYRVGPVVFPKVLCASINDEIVHGIPCDTKELREGDIVGLDFGVECDGFFADSAMTVAVGAIDEESRRLLEIAEESLAIGIEHAREGERLGDVGAAVQDLVEVAGFSVVRDFVGHGIGRALHEDPQVPNFGKRGRGRTLVAGMVIAIEPMVNAGSPAVIVDEDGWTARTADGRRSAHFEHTVAITKNGPEILTKV
jgi:methionyl aminopeptidase